MILNPRCKLWTWGAGSGDLEVKKYKNVPRKGAAALLYFNMQTGYTNNDKALAVSKDAYGRWVLYTVTSEPRGFLLVVLREKPLAQREWAFAEVGQSPR